MGILTKHLFWNKLVATKKTLGETLFPVKTWVLQTNDEDVWWNIRKAIWTSRSLYRKLKFDFQVSVSAIDIIIIGFRIRNVSSSLVSLSELREITKF